MILTLTDVASPLGDLVVVAHDGVLCALEFADEWRRAEERLKQTRQDVTLGRGDPAGATRRLDAYFSGELDALADLPIAPAGTPFQQRVWSELRKIPPGETITYRELARRVKSPSGVRAVGSANRLNPLAIVVPCHRVIGTNGDLRGYAGGLERKRWLLDHESSHWTTP